MKAGTLLLRQSIPKTRSLGRLVALCYMIYFKLGQIRLHPRLEASTEQMCPMWKLYVRLGRTNGVTTFFEVLLIRTCILSLACLLTWLSVLSTRLIGLHTFAQAMFTTVIMLTAPLLIHPLRLRLLSIPRLLETGIQCGLMLKQP